MNFTKHHRSYAVGAQFIGASPINRPVELSDGPLADPAIRRRTLNYSKLNMCLKVMNLVMVEQFTQRVLREVEGFSQRAAALV